MTPLGVPLELPATLVQRWPELAEARWRRGGWLLNLAGWSLGVSNVGGFTLGRTIWLHDSTRLEPEMLLHELAHVRQFRAHRWFAVRYLVESLRHGYERNHYEVEARSVAARRARNRN